MTKSVSTGEPLVVRDYDPEWTHQFAQECDRIHQAIGHLFLSIDHVGSTSIPGLSAKPIIDMQPVVQNFDCLSECVVGMQSLSYTYLGQYGIEGREYFKKPGFHVHVAMINSDEYMRKRLFLAYLHQNKDARDEYSNLKKGLAAKWHGEEDAHKEYGLDKTEFIMGILAKAGWDTNIKPKYLLDREIQVNK
ncbi:grpb/dephospho-CoA kinase [Coemansia spiralis]|nr:grpb/dephospho-CoA kinase [Coemansia spiralis]